MSGQNIGFVSTRFAGTDGVSLESAKWAEVLWDHGHVSHWYAGVLDRDPATSMHVPEAWFKHPEVVEIDRQAFGSLKRSPEVTRKIFSLAEYLKRTIYDFVEKFRIDILVVQNALCIPMHIPLGVALTQFIAECEFPTIAHHHDFYWERDRFLVNSVGDVLEMAFPPSLPVIQHVTINTPAQEDLAHRRGCSSILVPNVLDFETPPEDDEQYSTDFREEVGLAPDDVMILQPTRVVPRKGIEHAIALLAQLGDPRCKLVVSHESGDEGQDYQYALVELAENAGVDLRFIHARIGESRSADAEGRKIYSLADAYRNADLVTYPSIYEGFGNALLEAFYYKKPVVVNRYSIFRTDIEPRGFDVIAMDGFLTRSVARRVREVIDNADERQRMVERNYELATKFFSYAVLRRKLRALVCNFTGQDDL